MMLRGTPGTCPPPRHVGGGGGAVGSTPIPLGRCGVLGWVMSITEVGTAPPEPPGMPPGRFWGVPGQVVGSLPSKKGWGGCQVLTPPGRGRLWGATFRTCLQ